jgi:hypothetical protein
MQEVYIKECKFSSKVNKLIMNVIIIQESISESSEVTVEELEIS